MTSLTELLITQQPEVAWCHHNSHRSRDVINRAIYTPVTSRMTSLTKIHTGARARALTHTHTHTHYTTLHYTTLHYTTLHYTANTGIARDELVEKKRRHFAWITTDHLAQACRPHSSKHRMSTQSGWTLLLLLLLLLYGNGPSCQLYSHRGVDPMTILTTSSKSGVSLMSLTRVQPADRPRYVHLACSIIGATGPETHYRLKAAGHVR